MNGPRTEILVSNMGNISLSVLCFFKTFATGRPGDFPVLRDRSLQIHPGREHDLELGAQVVSSVLSTKVVLAN